MTTRLQPPAHATVDSEGALREIIGSPSRGVVMKKTAQIDDKARAFLGRSPFVAMTTCLPGGPVDISARGGDPGFIRVLDDRSLLIADHPADRLGDVSANLDAHSFVGLLAPIPGVNETLRINGHAEVTEEPEPAIRVTVEEMFYHCPKAFIRSHLWDAVEQGGSDTSDPLADDEVRLPALDVRSRALIQRSPFLFLGTSRADGNADVSPRGDPAGFVRILDDRTLLLPDRPGNRLADSFTNILAHPYAALLFLVPGSAATLQVRAQARIVTDPDLLQRLAVEGRTPKVCVWLDVEDVQLGDPPLLQRARLWDAAARAERSSVPSIGELMVSQLACAGRADGLSAEAIDTGVEQDAKVNLY